MMNKRGVGTVFHILLIFIVAGLLYFSFSVGGLYSYIAVFVTVIWVYLVLWDGTTPTGDFSLPIVGGVPKRRTSRVALVFFGILATLSFFYLVGPFGPSVDGAVLTTATAVALGLVGLIFIFRKGLKKPGFLLLVGAIVYYVGNSFLSSDITGYIGLAIAGIGILWVLLFGRTMVDKAIMQGRMQQGYAR